MRPPEAKIFERAALAERLRGARPARLALANGVFDLLHVGHARLLGDARSRVDGLVVALNDDASTRACKGPGRPILPLAERRELMASLRAVDWVTWFPEKTAARTLELLAPDYHVKGTDYRPGTLPADEQEVHRRLEIEVLIAGDPKSHATTDLISLIRSRRLP
jgi:rfaE bifunctional protein nucleotidyltransferase chain/domain